MNYRPSRRSIVRLVSLSLCAVVASAGCFWQQGDYTKNMEEGFKTYESRAELGRLLGDAYSPPGEFQMQIRPPKPAGPVQVPEDRKDLVAWFQGGDPILDLVVMGSSGPESLQEFRRVALGNLQAKHAAPAPTDYADREPQIDDSLYPTGGKLTFEFCLIESNRQIAAAPAPAVAYDWIIYFTEEGQQKVMLAYIVHAQKYPELFPAIERSRQSLLLGGKVAAAQGGGGSARGF